MHRDTYLVLHQELCREAEELTVRKNHDYAGKDGEDPFRNFRKSVVVGVSPGRGILIRMLDKISRLETALDAPLQVKNEGVRDSVIDIMNYAALFYGLYLDEDDKKEKNPPVIAPRINVNPGFDHVS
jgi:hypothetical protein